MIEKYFTKLKDLKILGVAINYGFLCPTATLDDLVVDVKKKVIEFFAFQMAVGFGYLQINSKPEDLTADIKIKMVNDGVVIRRLPDDYLCFSIYPFISFEDEFYF